MIIDALREAGLADMTDVVVTYDDTSERVTVRCAKDAVLELRGDIAWMFGFLNNRTIRAFDKKVSLLPYPKMEINNFYVYTYIIKSQYHTVLRSSYRYSKGKTWKLCQQELRKITLCASKQKHLSHD